MTTPTTTTTASPTAATTIGGWQVCGGKVFPLRASLVPTLSPFRCRIQRPSSCCLQPWMVLLGAKLLVVPVCPYPEDIDDDVHHLSVEVPVFRRISTIDSDFETDGRYPDGLATLLKCSEIDTSKNLFMFRFPTPPSSTKELVFFRRPTIPSNNQAFLHRQTVWGSSTEHLRLSSCPFGSETVPVPPPSGP